MSGRNGLRLTGLPLPPARLLSGSQAAAMLETARRVLDEIGIEVPDAHLRGQIVATWGREVGRRVLFAPEETAAYLQRWRERQGLASPGWQDEAGPVFHAATTLSLGVMPYSHTYHDPASDQLVPMTAQRLVEATRFLGTFDAQDLQSTVPGHPVDIPPPLQPVFQYKTGAQYNPAGGGYGWLGAPATARYVLRMAQVMGRPITGTVVYVFSPLRLGGQELETAIALRDCLQWVHVSNMGSCGVALPLHPRAAQTLAWAETLGGAMCVEPLTGLPTTWDGSVEPFDLRAQTIPFGAPEQSLLYRLTREASAWLRGESESGGHASLLTMAKRPGAQAMMEKGLAAALGVAAGCISLGAAGSLSADEVFSPVQVILDRELRDWLSRYARGLPACTEDPEGDLEQIRAGVERGGFLQADETVEHYRELCWFPAHMRREMLATWQALGGPEMVQTAHQEALQRLRQATWRLPEPQFSELEAIYQEAQECLGRSANAI